MKKAIVLLSGGLDSATVLYFARSKGYNVRPLIFDYGQRHDKEIKQALKIASKAGCEPCLVRISLPWEGSSLLGKGKPIPSGRRHDGRGRTHGIPSTYVPARNTIFLSFALSYAEASGAEAVFIGANAVDYSGYPDCRPEYFTAFKKLAGLATKKGVEGAVVRIEAPLLKMKKSEIIETGVRLGVPYELTWSCYRGGKKPCGNCDSCLLRAKGFMEAGLKDPAL